jgi:8-oxo-dGTP diphosphatase
MNVRVAAILPRGQEILLMEHRRRALACWVLPGGAVEEGETLVACVRRELREETGLEVEPGRLVYAADVVSPRRKYTVNLFFVCREAGGDFGATPSKQAGEHLDEPHWVRLDSLPPLYPPIADRLVHDAAHGLAADATYLGNLWTTEPGEQDRG